MILKGIKDALFAGPFVGEFGHELFSWQAYVRKYAKEFENVIICSRKEYKFLYEDFCDDFIEVDPNTFNAGTFMVLENKENVDKLCKKLESRYNINKQFTVMSPNILPETGTFNELKKIGSEYITYGNFVEDKQYDVIFHARNFQNFQGHLAKSKKSRDWDIKKWNDLAERLVKDGYKVGSIGLSGCAYHVEGSDNLLDTSLSELADILHSSKCITGPSSGPLHFASLCNCKQMVWSHPCNKNRYLTDWNPFNVDVTFYDKDEWNPSINTIEKMIKDLL